MVCVLHISTGQMTGLVIPYTVEDYHSWKTKEADILLRKAPTNHAKMLGVDKTFHVRWKSNSPKLASSRIVSQEEWDETYAPNTEVTEGDSPKFGMTGGGSFSVKVDGKRVFNHHLDFLARPLWNPDDKRTR